MKRNCIVEIKMGGVWKTWSKALHPTSAARLVLRLESLGYTARITNKPKGV